MENKNKELKQFHEITINLNQNEINDLIKYIDYAKQEARKEALAEKGLIKIEDIEKKYTITTDGFKGYGFKMDDGTEWFDIFDTHSEKELLKAIKKCIKEKKQ